MNEKAIMVVKNHTKATIWQRIKLFLIFGRVFPSFITDKITAIKYLNLIKRKPPSGVRIDIEKISLP